ncbi:hypothetical protein ACROYT_G009070 [Oculina patagonica]
MNASHGTFRPGCGVFTILGGTLPPSATEAKAVLLFLAVINIVTFPFTAALNALAMVIIAVKKKSDSEPTSLTYYSPVWVVILNSFLNPLLYSIRMRQFRVAFIELTCRTANVAEAEEIEMRVFGSPNAVGSLEARQGHERDQQNAEQADVNHTNNNNNAILPQHENHIEELN